MIWLWIYLAVVILTVLFVLWCLKIDRITLNFREFLGLVIVAPIIFLFIVATFFICAFDGFFDLGRK